MTKINWIFTVLFLNFTGSSEVTLMTTERTADTESDIGLTRRQQRPSTQRQTLGRDVDAYRSPNLNTIQNTTN